MKRYASAAQIKVGVVGYGPSFNIARHHLNEMKQAGMTPVAVADIDPARLPVAKTDFPEVETFPSATAMLAGCDVDLVAVCTPHNVHAPVAIECLEAGRNVVTEKPFAITTDECDAMIAAARRNRAMLSTYHNRHWDGHILEAVRRIGTGVLGDLVRVECRMGGYGKPGDWWRTSKSVSGGILYDWGVHLLEYALQVVQSDIVEVSGFAHSGFWQTRWGKDTNEDEATAVVRFKSGCMLTLRISSIEANAKPGIVEFVGTKGTYVMDFAGFDLITHTAAGETRVTKGRNPNGEGWKLYQNIADHLTVGEKMVITPEWARRPIHILDLANASARMGRALKAKYA